MWYIIVGYFLFSACAGESLYADVIDNVRVKRQNHHHQQHQNPLQQISYRPYNEAPDRIKQLLQAQQAREPLVHLPAPAAPQLQRAAAPTAHAAPTPQHQQVPLAQPVQYTPKVQYGQAPPQPTYKGIQPAQPSPQQGPGPLHSQGPTPQNTYTPQYKQQYNPQPAPNAVYRPAPPVAAQYQPQSQPAQSQFPKNLPLHIQKIIESQRAFQG